MAAFNITWRLFSDLEVDSDQKIWIFANFKLFISGLTCKNLPLQICPRQWMPWPLMWSSTRYCSAKSKKHWQPLRASSTQPLQVSLSPSSQRLDRSSMTSTSTSARSMRRPLSIWHGLLSGRSISAKTRTKKRKKKRRKRHRLWPLAQKFSVANLKRRLETMFRNASPKGLKGCPVKSYSTTRYT